MVVPISLFYYVYSPGRTIAATVPSHNNNNLPETNEATVRIDIDNETQTAAVQNGDIPLHAAFSDEAPINGNQTTASRVTVVPQTTSNPQGQSTLQRGLRFYTRNVLGTRYVELTPCLLAYIHILLFALIIAMGYTGVLIISYLFDHSDLDASE